MMGMLQIPSRSLESVTCPSCQGKGHIEGHVTDSSDLDGTKEDNAGYFLAQFIKLE